MQFKHQLDDWPSFGELILLGLQWFAISVPGIIIAGNLVGMLHGYTASGQVIYLQKLSFMVSVALFAQVAWGHRLPLVLGPSTVLLIGVITNRSFTPDAIYWSIILGGACLTAVSVTGLFGLVQKLFTSSVVAVVLILIALTLMPTVVNLIASQFGTVQPKANLLFALALTACMFIASSMIGVLGRSTLILWAMTVGTLLYYALFSPVATAETDTPNKLAALFLINLTTAWSFEPGVFVSFLFCFFALSVNDLGSIQSIKEMVNPPDMARRITRGITFTGMANVFAGFLGVVGPVNFSLSPGVLAVTRSASRFTLIPASVLLFFLSFSPLLMTVLSKIPPAVIGSSIIYLLYYQVTAGVQIIRRSKGWLSWKNALLVGFPTFVGTTIAFLPSSVFHPLPAVVRPVVGNGFVMGVFTVLLLEHILLTSHRSQKQVRN